MLTAEQRRVLACCNENGKFATPVLPKDCREGDPAVIVQLRDAGIIELIDTCYLPHLAHVYPGVMHVWLLTEKGRAVVAEAS